MNTIDSIVNLLAAEREFYCSLRRWYRLNARELPWRQTSDPYLIWVSEVMLQQTTVATVLPYYLRFIAAFPSVESLAAADELDVLRRWAGLGYYRRARCLHRAARIIVNHYKGSIPRDEKLLQCLPGIGPYTANAIACFAFNRRLPIIEANTRRVMRRLLAIEKFSNVSETALWKCAQLLLPRRGYREFNYALMELGSLICTERAPQCDRCPVVEYCSAFKESRGRAEMRRSSSQRTAVVHLKWRIWVFRTCEVPPALLVRRFSDDQWHAGLFGFPFEEVVRGPRKAQEGGEWAKFLRVAKRIFTMQFSITRHRIHADILYVPLRNREDVTENVSCSGNGLMWVTLEHLEELPLASPHRRVLHGVYDFIRGELEHAGQGADR
ncbi:MAG: A/G-specific adenine glycosylase [Candidatus Sumerlaeaceae bacterium]|nr:A/G-specific adenine glycosylase [Candidatus Sumerlaeaceae bacterium]